MNKINIKIDGIMCDKCRETIKNTLIKVEGIKEVTVTQDIASIKYDGKLNKKEIIDSINNIGFETKEEYFSK